MLKRNAFTLAEVLITLGIIGVVAAMTLPTLLTNTQQQTFRAQLKKSLTVLSQAASVNLAIDDYDPATAGAGTGASSMYQIYKNRTNVLSTGTASVGNWAASTRLNSGTAFTPNDRTYYIFNYNDGSSFLIQQNANNGSNCKFIPNNTVTDPLTQTNVVSVTATNPKKLGMCVAFIDVNGPKAPNTMAKCDIGNNRDTCKVTNAYDVFPVLVDGSNLYLATWAATAFYQNKK